MLAYETNEPFRAIADAFVRIQVKTKFPAGAGLAIWACESAWGTRLTGDFNYWGITRAPESGPAKFCDTHEDLTPEELARFRPDEIATAVRGPYLGNGKYRYQMKRWFASYGSVDESLEAFVDFFIDSPGRYKAAWQEYLAQCGQFPAMAAVSLLKAICEAGYATGDAETTELAVMGQANIRHAIQMAERGWRPPTEMSAA